MNSADHTPLLMCYGKTPYTPGSYLERALRRIGTPVDTLEQGVDFAKIDLEKYKAVLFVESPARPPVAVTNRHLVKLPVIHWIHHGENRLDDNLRLTGVYRPDLILMSHSLHLAPLFSASVEFFPFGADPHIFRSDIPLSNRTVDISFAGSHSPIYAERDANLRFLETSLSQRNCSFRKNPFLEKLSDLYGNSKIVFNQTADHIKTFNMRIFEAMSCGALALTDDTPEQSRLFQDGKHYILFNSRKDLLEKAYYYLEHVDEASKIAAAGQKYVLESHTYEHRARRLLELI